MTDSQLAWFAQTLYDLGGKSDASGWGFIVLGHYPLDWGYARSGGKVLKAYLDGGSIAVGSTAVDFSGRNSAVCYGNFHGHLHNLLSGKIYVVPDNVSASNPPTTRMPALRVCTPSANFYRTNEVGENNRLDSNYIEFGEETTYSKSEGEKDTAFTVNVINPSEKKIYSFCYGSGYDRTLSFDFAVVMHRITTSLTHCTISNPATAIEDGASYAAALTLDRGYSFETVTVTMGGTNITSASYSKGAISIANVTGDVFITAIASKEVNYTNLIHEAVESDGSLLPYKDGYSLDSSGAEASGYSGLTVSGFIPIGKGDSKGTMVSTAHIYRVAGDGITWPSTEEHCRIAWYNADFEFLKMVPSKRVDASEYFPSSIEESTTAITLKVTNGSGAVVNNVPATAAYFRVSAKGSGANLIITLDEEIK